MILIVGFGNPGKKFEKTRHNIGFRIIDEIAVNFQFSVFNFKSIFNSQISKGKIGKEKVVLVKPQTFMNNSGVAVRLLIKNLKLETKNLIIIHDDLDFPLGKFKIVKNRSSGGHKGVESIIKELKTKDFIRFRIGIKSNSKFKIQNSKVQVKSQNFVLGKFTKEEDEIVKKIVQKTCRAVETALKQGVNKAMNEYNK